MRSIIAFIITNVLAVYPGITFAKASKLSVINVTSGQVSKYQCDNGIKVNASYYELSDKSLGFVKLNLNGKNYTLPQLVSANGTRYSDERDVEWWAVGDKAMLRETVGGKQVDCKTR